VIAAHGARARSKRRLEKSHTGHLALLEHTQVAVDRAATCVGANCAFRSSITSLIAL